MSDAKKPDPEWPDDDNPEWTLEDMAKDRPAAEVRNEPIDKGTKAELFERSKLLGEQREWDAFRAYGEARFRATLQAEGLDPDRMTEEEKMDFVDRAIHEYRQEQSEKKRARKDVHIPPQ